VVRSCKPCKFWQEPTISLERLKLESPHFLYAGGIYQVLTVSVYAAGIHRVMSRHSNLWPRHDLHVVGHDDVLCEAGEDLSRYINKTESIGLRKAAESNIKSTRRLSVYISLPHIMAAKKAGIDRNEEITSLSPFDGTVLMSSST